MRELLLLGLFLDKAAKHGLKIRIGKEGFAVVFRERGSRSWFSIVIIAHVLTGGVAFGGAIAFGGAGTFVVRLSGPLRGFVTVLREIIWVAREVILLMVGPGATPDVAMLTPAPVSIKLGVWFGPDTSF
jgi:hypothetical protein